MKEALHFMILTVLADTAALQWTFALAIPALLAGYAIRALVQRLRDKRHPLQNISAVTLLPKQTVCCGGALSFSMPMEFRLEKQTNGNAIYVGNGNVRLTVMQLPLRVRIRTLTGTELERYFSEAIPMRSTPEVSYGYLGHSPTLTAWWRSEPVGTLACMHLIQVREAVFLMQFTGIRMEAQRFVEPMLFSVSVQQERIRTAPNSQS